MGSAQNCHKTNSKPSVLFRINFSTFRMQLCTNKIPKYSKNLSSCLKRPCPKWKVKQPLILRSLFLVYASIATIFKSINHCSCTYRTWPLPESCEQFVTLFDFLCLRVRGFHQPVVWSQLIHGLQHRIVHVSA